MRLRTFTGKTLTEAMGTVRREMGPDAVIISTHDAPNGGVEVRAAAESASVPASADSPKTAIARRGAERERAKSSGDGPMTRIARALAWHEIADRPAEALMESAMSLEDGEATATLARAIDARYAVHPIEPVPQRPLLFAGAPGSGKSSVIAKLAARAVAQGANPLIIGADQGAGAAEQLATYARALGVRLEIADGANALISALDGAAEAPVLIDSAAVNPFDLDALEALRDLSLAADAEIVAVIEAGIAPGDAEDASALFASIGAGRAVLTKLDSARRLGALMGPGEAGLAYAQISASPYIGSGLAPATALRLARALLDELNHDPEEETP
jgi:flagellar biosynthesis protein FlhF